MGVVGILGILIDRIKVIIKSMITKEALVGIGVAGLFMILLRYLQEYSWTEYVFFIGLFGFIGFIMIREFIAYIEDFYADIKLMKSLKLADRLTINEIASLFIKFKTNKYSVRFVEMLAERKVVATGEWPGDFALNARDNQAITQLARLEEKWLGLDR